MIPSLALFGAPPVRSNPTPVWPRATQDARDLVLDVLESGHWWQSGGGMSERLEAELQRETGSVGAVCVANGTLALEAALVGLGVGAGDEVIVPATTFVSTALAVSRIGAMPVPVDVDARTYCIDLESAAAALTPRTACVVIVHLAGHPADLTAARAFADRHGLALLEDAAQAVSARWEGRRVCTVGDASVLSFQAAKLLPGGDGGAVLIRSDLQVAETVERYANCGRRRGSTEYDHRLLATNARISEFSAALVLDQRGDYEALWRVRDTTAREALTRLAPLDPNVAPHLGELVDRHDWYMLLLRTPPACTEEGIDGATFARALTAEGIACRRIYPPWQATSAYRASFRPGSACPRADEIGRDVVWVHHAALLDPTWAEDVAASIARIVAAAGELARCSELEVRA